jgi:hypothetical protein
LARQASYDHTGDDALVKELWPGPVKGVERFLSATDPDNDGWPGHGHGCLPPDMSKPETKILL